MSPYIILVAAVLLAVLFAIKNLRGSKLPPSPPSLPLLGHLHLMGRLPHRSLHALHSRYGSDGGLLYLRLGRAGTLVVSTAAAGADLFKNHDLVFASRPQSAAADKLFYGARNVSFAPYGDPWRRAKKLAVVHLLSPRRATSFAPARAAEAAALAARARRAAEAGEAVELRELLYGYTNAVVTRAAAGGIGTAVTFRKMMADTSVLAAGFQAVDLLPSAVGWVLRRVTGLEKRLDDMAEESDKLLSEIVAAHEEKGVAEAEEEEEDFVDVLLRLRKEGSGGFQLTEDDIKSIVKDMIAAATDTSFVTLEWAMTELIRNPRVMAKLQDEIRRVNNSKPAIQEDDLSQMEYLKAVLKEVLRLHPPAPLLIPRESTTAAVVQGYEIPDKTCLFINVWAIGRDPVPWDAPEEFRPERFAGSPVDFRGNDYQFIPFGAGRRMCPGINFALPAVEMALASLMYHFDWELPGGMTAQDLDVGEAPGLTTPLKKPLCLVPICKTLA